MILPFYTFLLFIALAQCSSILVDDACIKQCAEDLPEAQLKAIVLCIDFCKQTKRSYQIEEDSIDEPKTINSVTSILTFLKNIINNLILISKRFPPLEDKSSEGFVTFLEPNNFNSDNDDNMPSIFRKKRDAEFTANLRGRAQADTVSDFTFDSAGLSGKTNAVVGYEGAGRGTGRLSAGALNLQGDWEGDVAGQGEFGLQGKLSGLDSGFQGQWAHEGEANVGGKGTASIYGLTVGGAGGKAQAKYAGEGAMIGGIGRGGLVGVEYESVNGGSLYGMGAAGVGNSLIGIGAGISGEGGGEATSKGKGGLGLVYGENGLGLRGTSQGQTNMAGGLDLAGGIGSYDKYAHEDVWRGS